MQQSCLHGVRHAPCASRCSPRRRRRNTRRCSSTKRPPPTSREEAPAHQGASSVASTLQAPLPLPFFALLPSSSLLLLSPSAMQTSAIAMSCSMEGIGPSSSPSFRFASLVAESVSMPPSSSLPSPLGTATLAKSRLTGCKAIGAGRGCGGGAAGVGVVDAVAGLVRSGDVSTAGFFSGGKSVETVPVA